MNVVCNTNKKIAKELLDIAREFGRVAGIVQPPPAMVDDIVQWAEAQMAAHRAWHAEEDLVESRGYLQRALDQAAEAREKGNLEYAKEREERAQWFRDGIAKEEKHLERFIQEAKSYPRVRIKKWNRIKRKFKADLRGWKYLPLLKKADPSWKRMADVTYGVITVELVRGKLSGKADAYWKPSSATIRITTGAILHQIVQHEMVHWAQDYLSLALHQTGKTEVEFGKPSKGIRDEDVSQQVTHRKTTENKQLIDELGKKGIKRVEIHDLDDVEFYTGLLNAVNRWPEYISTKRAERVGPDTMFKIYVGAIEDESIHPSRFFVTLKRHSRSKWQKAVKELAKAVL